ncbi:hypothetical protein QWI17_18975 [Gilvimarinus sp. SDUM040013]|uniref:DUF4189 domain-containing protein n=2 Tax=Gilvimarinus gilvus TaxID=3058038 RepID=A0ABU4RYJ2_9GAMM|nr:hypothetical protein [Gilvimarinus sp. SDUM040013]MDO3387936.1 hypothetical protein [Gilvimarinus sp. SDUM040013]MDX6848693.1 hypothetical protein [Gilvimarinus sp. SDUM040013]
MKNSLLYLFCLFLSTFLIFSQVKALEEVVVTGTRPSNDGNYWGDWDDPLNPMASGTRYGTTMSADAAIQKMCSKRRGKVNAHLAKCEYKSKQYYTDAIDACEQVTDSSWSLGVESVKIKFVSIDVSYTISARSHAQCLAIAEAKRDSKIGKCVVDNVHLENKNRDGCYGIQDF